MNSLNHIIFTLLEYASSSLIFIVLPHLYACRILTNKHYSALPRNKSKKGVNNLQFKTPILQSRDKHPPKFLLNPRTQNEVVYHMEVFGWVELWQNTECGIGFLFYITVLLASALLIWLLQRTCLVFTIN
jgi:hypothetical protein